MKTLSVESQGTEESYLTYLTVNYFTQGTVQMQRK